MITLPYMWRPRPYQVEAFKWLDSGTRRILTIWHRRSGKDAAGVNYIAKAAHQRIGNYWHLFPTARQGRKALWEAIGKDGRRVIDQAFPEAIRASTRNDEMLIKLKCGSTFQITGADQADSLVGSNPVGVVMSEYSLTSPRTWRFIEPILIENGGWCWFNGTPRGRNHMFEMYRANLENPDWRISIKPWWETGVLTQADIDAVLRSGTPKEIVDQEYGCSFDAPNVGLVYGAHMAQAERDGRLTSVPHDARYPVEGWWDIGHRDATAIWLVQHVRNHINVIDFITDTKKGLPDYANAIHQRPYAYSRHVGPHDLEQKLWAPNTTTIDIARNHGINFVVAPKLRVAEGIEAARGLLSRCQFDVTKCAEGIEALRSYQYGYDEDTRVYTTEPVHDWSSHAADAFRYGAVTPQTLGIMPNWAQSLVGRNGGPLLDDDNFDPLSHWRGGRSAQSSGRAGISWP